ncbi:hypothetical protein [Streptococcus intermedius]|uniref:hypothetical protein n=1 Tax=Streptococcus intermedius TaxID=1338 RepID=UPI000F68D4B4|nr:hypothetical protein [Streptococcus intermedius]RSJ26393.1 hypothetical protein D8826_03745 [Streptococcus intermedius]
MYIDLETEMYLQKLDSEIRQQTYWGVVPEMPIEWQPDQLGFYLSDPISLPAFLTKLRVFEKGFTFDYIEEDVFERKITVFAINENKEKFLAKIEKLLDCQSKGEMCETLLYILATPVTYIDEAVC